MLFWYNFQESGPLILHFFALLMKKIWNQGKQYVYLDTLINSPEVLRVFTTFFCVLPGYAIRDT